MSLLMACEPRVSTDDHLAALRMMGTWPQVLVSTAGCSPATIAALQAAAPTARLVEGGLCTAAEAHRRCAAHASGDIHLLVHAGRPVAEDQLRALVAGLSSGAAACIGVVPESSVPESSLPESSLPEAVLGGRADLSCLAIRRSMWTRLPGLRDVDTGLLGVFALRAALLRQCVSVAWDPPVPVSTPRVDDHLRGEARSALDVRELLAVLHYAHQHLPPRAAGPAVRIALDAVVSRLDPWVRHRQALYNQAHTTAWIAPLPDGTPVLPGLVAPREPGISGPSGPGGLQ